MTKITIRFTEPMPLVLEQKTDGGYTETRTFSKGDTLDLLGIDTDPHSDGKPTEWVDLFLAPVEAGWVARGVHTAAFEVVT